MDKVVVGENRLAIVYFSTRQVLVFPFRCHLQRPARERCANPHLEYWTNETFQGGTKSHVGYWTKWMFQSQPVI